MKKALCLMSVGFFALALAACTESKEEPAPVEQVQQDPLEPVAVLDGDTGKGDGVLFKVKDYFRHTKELVLRDLIDRVASMATDELNDQLSAIPYVDIKLGETTLYGLEKGFEGGSEIASVKTLLAGLTQRFGEKDFVTEINTLRQAHLESSGDEYFAENEFKVDFKSSHSFHTEVLDVAVALGFSPQQTLRSRVVVAHDGNLEAMLKSPLEALSEMRGFVLPRSADDLRKLKPGESIALSGKGVIGANIGANIPIFGFSPIDHLVVNARFSIGAHVQLGGELDVQLIRGAGNLLYADVGLGGSSVKGVNVGVNSGWGLTDFPELLSVSIAGKEFTLGSIAEKVIRNYISKKKLLSYGVNAVASSSEERVSISRFEFDLSSNSEEIDAAIAQLVGGDVRLAQSLADRDGSGVRALVSLERNVNSRRRYLGAHISSMLFFTETTTDTGKIYIQDGDSAQEILYETLKKSTGKFWNKWGHKRTLVTSQTWLKGRLQGAEANLRIAVSESDSFTERDQVLDHVDAALLTLMDYDTLYLFMTQKFEELQHIVDLNCEECDDEHETDFFCEEKYEECVAKRITDARKKEWRAELKSRTDEVLTEIADPAFHKDFASAAAIVAGLLDLKLALSSVKETQALFSDTTGRTSILSDARFSQGGLDYLFRNITPEVFDERMREMLTLIVSKRSKEHDKKFEKAMDWLEDEDDKLDDMRDLYAKARKSYLALDEVSGVRIQNESVGNGAYVLAIAQDHTQEGKSPWDEDEYQYAKTAGDGLEITMRSLAEQKGVIAAELFDELTDRADDLGLLQAILKILSLGLADTLGFESHHLVAYTLNSLVPAEHREWLISMDFEEDAFTDINLYSRSKNDGEHIEAGEFDLDLLLGL